VEPEETGTYIVITNKPTLTMELKYIIASVVYSFIGITILGLCFWVFEKVTPENIWKEIIEKQNIAIAIVSAAFMLAIAIIIASSIHS
jgi:putative membrane protein